MEGLAALNGGRHVKAGLLAFGALVWAAPVCAQSQDPLAPLPNSANARPGVPQVNQSGLIFTSTVPRSVAVPGSASADQPVSAIGSVPTSPTATPIPTPTTVTVPKDWRG